MSRALELLEEGRVIVADGGTGALVTAAVPRLRCPEEANLKAPESIVSLHLSFIRAGADLIETNTFGANRRKLAAHYLESETQAINNAAVKLAREAREVSGREVFIAGSIGPLGDQDVASDKRRELFGEQAAILDGRGVDVLVVETFFDLAELLDAIEGVRRVSSLPLIARPTVHMPAFSPSSMPGSVSSTLTHASTVVTPRLIAFCRHMCGYGRPWGTSLAHTVESGA